MTPEQAAEAAKGIEQMWECILPNLVEWSRGCSRMRASTSPPP